jgi:tetratricopeptide (TPR) repeat protein
MQAKSAEAYVAPRERNPDIPADLDALCRGLLRVGVDARPRADETLRVFQPVDAAASDTALPIVAPAEVFVGRAAELAALRAAHADCAGGVPVVVHLSGEPGIGKTALVHAFLDELPSDARVLHGRCYQQESVPFKALDAVIDELAWDLRRRPASELQALLPRDANLLARVFPVLQQLVGATDGPAAETSGFHPLSLRRRAFAALRELLRRLSHVAPIVVWIDDLQWGDRDSAAVLHALLRPGQLQSAAGLTAPPRLLLILSYRDASLTPTTDHPFLRELQALEDEAGALPGTRAIVLQRLAEADGRALVDALVAAHAPPNRRARVVREAAGIPLLLDRLARSVAVPSDSSSRLAEPSQEFDDGRDLLAQLVDRQLAGLPAAARAALELVAVAGAPLDLRALRIAAGQPTLGRTLLQPLRARHLVTLSSSEQVAPAFAQVAAILVAGLAPDVLRRHHLALAAALAGHAPPRRVATHYAAAGQLDQAGAHALTAARQAADALAFTEAAACYRLALTWRPGDAAQQRRLRRALADSLVNAGRCSEAAHLYLDLAEGSAPAEAIVLRRLAAEQLISCGELDRGEAELRAAVRAQGLDYPASTRAAMLAIAWGLVRLKLRGTRYTPRSADQVDPVALARVDTCLSASRNLSLSRSVHAVCFAVTSLRLALDCGEHGRVVEGLAAVGGALGLTGNATGKQLFAQAEALADTLTTARARGVVALWRGFFSYGEGRWADARKSWSDAAALLGETPGLIIDILRAQAYLLLADMHLGQYRELELHTSAAMAVARETGNLYTEVTALMYSALPRLAAGDLPGARERIRESEARTPRDSWNGFSRMKLHVQCDFYAGDGAAALARLEAALPEIEATRMRSFTTFRVVVGALHAGAALQVLADGNGDRKTLLKIVRRELARFLDEPMPFARGLVAVTRAALARAEGDHQAAVQLLGLAVHEFTAGDCWVEATCASRRLGQLRGDATLVASADATLRGRGIADPARWAACFAPGFTNPDLPPPQ